MKNIFNTNKQPEITPAMRAEMLADFDAENREHERIEYEHAKQKLGDLAAGQHIEQVPEEAPQANTES